MTSAPVDETFVAQAASIAAAVPLRDEVVLVDETGRATAISGTGALIWERLDGEVPLGELIDDLSDHFDHERSSVRHAVLDFVGELGRLGLLAGVDPSQFEVDSELRVTLEPIVQPAVGEEVADFTLPDLDGRGHSLSDHRGREVLLINWNPDCGYCALVAPRLATWSATLQSAGVDLVFVTSGDVEGARRWFDDAGLEKAVGLLGDGAVHPFHAFGTPAAYHLDRDGRLAAPLAFGSDDVVALAARLGRVTVDEGGSSASQTGARYLLTGTGVCAPRVNSGSATSWTETRAYRIADYHVGLRSNNETTAALLDDLFAHRVEDPRAEHSYSLALYDARSDRSTRQRRLNLLVQGGEELVRSRSRERVLRALLARLSDDIVGFDATSGRIRVRATAAMHEGSGLLLPDGLVRLGGFEPRFARAGISLADCPFPEIDVDTAELVIPEPSIQHNAEMLRACDEGVDLGAEQPCVLPGRYPLTTWCVARFGDVPSFELSAAAAAVAVLPLAIDTEDVAERVEQLGSFFMRTPARAFGIVYHSEAGMVEAVVDALHR